MAVIALQLREHYCVIAADGAEVEGRTGLVRCIRSAMVCMPDRNALVAVTGPRGMAEFITLHTPQHVTDHDTLVEALPSMLTSALQSCASQQFGFRERPPSGVVIVGWSSRKKRFIAHRAKVRPKLVSNSGAPVPIEMEEISTTTIWRNFTTTPGIRGDLDLDRDDNDDMDRLVRNVWAARMQHAAGPTSKPVAGGFIQLAVLRRDLQRTWIAHRWEADRVGAIIDPSKDGPMPSRFFSGVTSFP